MIHEIKNEFLTVTVSDVGAELWSITGADKTEYLWYGDSEYWSSRASNLFPICGRLTEGRFTYRGKSYEMRLHGFARHATFELVSQKESEIEFELVSNDTTRAQYPFDFVLRIGYALCGKKLGCRMTVLNTSGEMLPFSVGGHPGFNLPLAPNVAFEDYYLEFSEKSTPSKLLFSETCYPTGKVEPFPLVDGKILPLHHNLFDNDAIFIIDMPQTVTLKSDKDSHSVKLTCRDMTHLGFWHKPKTAAPFVCIEPWHGLPATDGVVDDLESKAGMLRIDPGTEYTFSYDIEFN